MRKYFIPYFLFLLSTLTLHSQSVQQLQRLQEIKNEKEAAFVQKKQEAIEKAQQMRIPIRQKFPNGNVIELMFFIGNQPFYLITDNANAARTISTNLIQPGGITGYNLDGNTEELAIWDEGRARVTHQEFDGRVVVNDGSTINSNHSTHVAGTMVAQGQNTNARGMSFEADLLSHDWNADEAEMANEAAAGLFVSNHSYGFLRGWAWNGVEWIWWGDGSISNTQDYLFGFYDATAQGWDEIANNAPYYLICKSAGNDRGDGPDGLTQEIDGGDNGYDCISQTGVAKNILTIGAVNDIPAGYSAPANVVMTGFSGWGPTDDGRIKPELVANGVDLFSPIATSDNAYDIYSGTSMATPNVAGSIGLLLQHQRNNYSNVVLRASTMKALLIHTADEAGPDPGPDYMYGWGLVNIRHAADLIETSANHCINISEYNLTQNEVIEIPVVKDAGNELRVTICWNDPAGTPPAASLNPTNRMLVNDIDLRVIGGGTTYFPWMLNRDNPANSATHGDNIVDNVEQVVVNSSYNGIYTIRISHKGTLLNNSQIVSVIISGNEDINSTINVDYHNLFEDMSFWAHDDISSTSTSIDVGGDITFIAGNSIRLKSGFTVKNGAYLNAKIDESLTCSAGTFGLKSTNAPDEAISSRFIYERNILSKSDLIRNNIAGARLDVSNSDIDGFYIYPNPSNGILYLEFAKDIPNSIEIIDVSGKLVYSINQYVENTIQLDLSNNTKGIYIIKFMFDKEVVTRKLILN